MKLQHVALYTRNLETMRQFYEKYFGAQASQHYHNPKTGFQSYFLSFTNGCQLEIMTRPDMVDAPQHPYRSGYAHLAFTVGTCADVDRLTVFFTQQQVTIVSEPRCTGDGYYESCILDPDGNHIELVADKGA